MSPISSRKSVPPSASSNFPCRRAAAPVKAPFSWPNSSLSIRESGRAAQFSATKGMPERPLRRWISRATSSFPVPLSPLMSTETSVGATRSTISKIFFMTGLVPTMAPKPFSWLSSSFRIRFSSARKVRSLAFLTRSRSSSTSKGFDRYS